MRNFTIRRLEIFKPLFFVLFFVSSQIRAQFPFLQSFLNTTASRIQFVATPSSFLIGNDYSSKVLIFVVFIVMTNKVLIVNVV